jgi:hypothetical protein|tara:strand:+ start:1506 stop:1790 length:285 start_codon:yes stop_codon:yes gene_type:complete
MKYFILLALSLIFLCFPACCGDDSNDGATPAPAQDVTAVGDAVSETSSDVTTPEEVLDTAQPPEVVSDTVTTEPELSDTASVADAPEGSDTSSD